MKNFKVPNAERKPKNEFRTGSALIEASAIPRLRSRGRGSLRVGESVSSAPLGMALP
jgi:hypothetical protein